VLDQVLQSHALEGSVHSQHVNCADVKVTFSCKYSGISSMRNRSSPKDPTRSPGTGLRKGPRGLRFVVSEVLLYCSGSRCRAGGGGTDPESYITKHSSVHEEKRWVNTTEAQLWFREEGLGPVRRCEWLTRQLAWRLPP